MRKIALECKPDEALVKALGYVRKYIYHQYSKGEVINFLEKNPGSIGIVDEDPGTAMPGYFSMFSKEGETKFDLDLYRIVKSQTTLIVIKPELENWIVKYAKAAKIKSNLLTDAHDLHKVINKRIPQFEQLLADMMKKSPALKHLKNLIDKA